jgi:PPM family protein phosphatase
VAATQCPSCGEAAGEKDRYCEACGQDLKAPPGAAAAPVNAGGTTVHFVSSSAEERCPGCGGNDFGAEGYCESCGQRRPTAPPHSELDLGAAAGVSDRGHRVARNEDAFALGRVAGALVAVVCDGVGSSTRPDAASHAAVDAAIPVLLDRLGADDRARDPGKAIVAAARAAQAATALVAGPQPGQNPPSSTFVCAVRTGAAVTVGWVGDSRAYWLPDSGEAVMLTEDDSVPGRFDSAAPTGAAGVAPTGNAGALLRWLGADSRNTEPRLRSIDATQPGRVLICSDGLFRYRPVVAELAASVPDRGTAPIAAARDLVQLALDEGGADNVTVAILGPLPGELVEPAASHPAGESHPAGKEQ